MSLSYQNNQFFIENLSAHQLADEISTPFYAYSEDLLLKNYDKFAQVFNSQRHLICYAIKANHNLSIIRKLAELGAGADTVSEGEIRRALECGVKPEKIVFAGVGKTRQEMQFALQNGVLRFSVESRAELLALSDVADDLGVKALVSIRVNPDISAKTHDKISTGRKGDKFGVDIDVAPALYHEAKELPGIKLHGISTHIGSQITSLEPFRKAFAKLRDLCIELRKDGINIESLDFGGGIGINYQEEQLPIMADYAKMIHDLTDDLDLEIIVAPGRAIVGEIGVLVTKIVHIKETDHRNFVIVDAAMNDIMRPGLYDAYHKITPTQEKTGQAKEYDIVGPICETTDILGKKRSLTNPQEGDLLIIHSAGAYCSSMSNNYNSRILIPEILVSGDKFKTIRKKQTYEEMWDLKF